MNPIRSPRLLPWSGPDGKPCYLIGDGTGRLSRLADQIETVQIGLARQVLERAHGTLSDPAANADELHTLARHLTDALRDALLIAECRAVPHGPVPS
ncbi:hypothetical protein ACF06X_23935 [Streptomyces sp. NPDC015346]|uniref:hypothetical protein n=1 Tax=Streptomyces sp. NPDC015346 TaxID=3364954 RepID=UPI0036FDDC85